VRGIFLPPKLSRTPAFRRDVFRTGLVWSSDPVIRDFGFDRPDGHPYTPKALYSKPNSKLASPNRLEIVWAPGKALHIVEKENAFCDVFAGNSVRAITQARGPTFAYRLSLKPDGASDEIQSDRLSNRTDPVETKWSHGPE
jgi:hypothetical protein